MSEGPLSKAYASEASLSEESPSEGSMPDAILSDDCAARAPVTVALRPAGPMVLLLGPPGAAAPDLPGLRAVAPGQWLLLDAAAADAGALAARLPGFAASEQGHGRLRLVVEGPAAAALLAMGTGVDLEAMAIGASAATLFGPIGAHLTRTGPEAWEILVLRSFADSLRQDLEEMAREFEA